MDQVSHYWNRYKHTDDIRRSIFTPYEVNKYPPDDRQYTGDPECFVKFLLYKRELELHPTNTFYNIILTLLL